MFNRQTVSDKLSVDMFKSQQDQNEALTKEDIKIMISKKFNDFKNDKPLQNLIDEMLKEILNDLTKHVKTETIKLVSKQFEPYVNKWDSKEDEKIKSFARAMNLADNKVYNSLHDFREQELKKYGWWKYKWDIKN